MIVVDTSALLAVLGREPLAAACTERLTIETDVLICSGTMTEALIVATQRSLATEMAELVADLRLQIVTLDAAGSARAATAYSLWGKGVHPARLNFGDCFAYALAKHRRCPLLYIGNDFARTDIAGAL